MKEGLLTYSAVLGPDAAVSWSARLFREEKFSFNVQDKLGGEWREMRKQLVKEITEKDYKVTSGRVSVDFSERPQMTFGVMP
jgi:hypothetical protein